MKRVVAEVLFVCAIPILAGTTFSQNADRPGDPQRRAQEQGRGEGRADRERGDQERRGQGEQGARERRGQGQRGGGQGGDRGGFGISRLALLRIPAVQKELELLDYQVEAIQKLQEELGGQIDRGQGQRGEGQAGEQRGGRQRGGGGGGDRGGRRGQGGGDGRGDRGGQGQPGVSELELERGEFFVLLQDPRGQRDSQDLSEEERQKIREERRKQAEERAKIEKAKLAEILMPHQMNRLEEIYIQVLGVRALQDPDVVRKLGITTRQLEQIEKVQTEARERNRSQMESLSQSGDREQIRERMTKLRKESDDKVLAVLTAAQRTKFAQMKGEPLELPEDAIRGGGGRDRGGGGNRDRGRGQGGEGRSQRPPADN